MDIYKKTYLEMLANEGSEAQMNFSKSAKSILGLVDDVIRSAKEDYKNTIEIEDKPEIPSSKDIPLEKTQGIFKWLKIPDVVSVFVDIKGSTKLSAEKYDKSTAKVYQYFTDSAIRTFHLFGASYIDIKGDGVFALFSSNQVHRALCAAVTFKTHSEKTIMPDITAVTQVEGIGTHIGIDQKTVLVKRIGIKSHSSQTDERKNEVWAGEPINMSSKLASLSNNGTLIVSDRYYSNLKSDEALSSCGCGTNGTPSPLWKQSDIPKNIKEAKGISFDIAWVLQSTWCEEHGEDYCAKIMKNDE